MADPSPSKLRPKSRDLPSSASRVERQGQPSASFVRRPAEPGSAFELCSYVLSRQHALSSLGIMRVMKRGIAKLGYERKASAALYCARDVDDRRALAPLHVAIEYLRGGHAPHLCLGDI